MTPDHPPAPPPSGLPPSALPVVAGEAALIAELLRRQVPRYRRTVREVRLPPDTPALIEALWAALGWSPVFDAGRLRHPDPETAGPIAARLMAEYGQGEPDHRLTPDLLPD